MSYPINHDTDWAQLLIRKDYSEFVTGHGEHHFLSRNNALYLLWCADYSKWIRRAGTDRSAENTVLYHLNFYPIEFAHTAAFNNGFDIYCGEWYDGHYYGVNGPIEADVDGPYRYIYEDGPFESRWEAHDAAVKHILDVCPDEDCGYKWHYINRGMSNE